MDYPELIKLQPIVSVIANIDYSFAVPTDITQFTNQVRMRWISQLIKNILSMLQKLLKYFDCTIVLAFFVQLFSFSLDLSCLNFNETLSSINLTKMPASFKAGLSL